MMTEDMNHTSFRKKLFHHHSNSCEANTAKQDEQLPSSFGSPRVSNRQKLTRENYMEMEEKVQQHFGKKFSFDPSKQKWKLPEPDEMFTASEWEDEYLQHMKQALNTVKSKLNDYYLADWHKHTRAMNMAAYILKAVKTRFQAEFVTQAWCKFYETVMSYNLIPLSADNNGGINSLHLCEAPGAFIAALNHYLKLNKTLNNQWKWLSTTLNPYYEGNPLSCMINDDRFILHTLENWTFGADFTGNLMDPVNLKYLLEETRKIGDILLVTADGSIDCQENPGEQEHIVSSLHYCEAVTALHALAPGGSFLLKIFTMYEHKTICLLYLLCCAFKDVHIFKPATSKEGNSEVYAVCLEYIGSEAMEPWLKVLWQHYGEMEPHRAMFSRSVIPESFIQSIYNCAEKFKNIQVSVIERNIAVFEGKVQPFEFNRKLRDMVTEHYIQHCNLRKLKDDDYIVAKGKLMETVALNVCPKNEDGSFNERRKKQTLNPSERLTALLDDVTSLGIEWRFGEHDIKWVKFSRQSIKKFNVQKGKPICTVESSKFCLGPLLRIYNQVLRLAEEKFGSIIKPQTSKIKDNTGCNMIHDKYPELLRHKKEPKTIDFGERLWTAMARGKNTVASRDALYEIADMIEELWRGEILLVIGYPLLTQLNVGIVFLLSHMFEKVGFIKPHEQDCAIVFDGYCSGNCRLREFISNICHEMTQLEDEGGNEAVVAVIPINVLCDGPEEVQVTHGETLPYTLTERGASKEESSYEIGCRNFNFYTWVTQINNVCVKEQIIHFINSVLK